MIVIININDLRQYVRSGLLFIKEEFASPLVH